MPMEDEFITLQKEKVTIKEVMIMHIKKISDLSCKEFTPSFWSKKPMKMGDGVAIVETYHPDTRLAYINAVNFLLDLLMPKADTKFKEVLKTMQEAEAESFKEYKDEKKTQDDWTWIKLELSKTLFGQIILLIDRIRLFDPTPIMSQQDIEELMEFEDEKELEQQNDPEKTQ
ncbi:MAG: hypothetical protein KAJ49_03375 [Arcobacteraceae bacterium]|nr:hypothetical protein [Arcobacteraceae bacterium]